MDLQTPEVAAPVIENYDVLRLKEMMKARVKK